MHLAFRCGDMPTRKIALLCLLLTVWSALTAAAHQHSTTDDATKCTVCIAAHSASPKTTFTPLRARHVGVSVLQAEPVARKQRLISFALSVRPPPID